MSHGNGALDRRSMGNSERDIRPWIRVGRSNERRKQTRRLCIMFAGAFVLGIILGVVLAWIL
jgi:hypothetical protein